MKVKRWYDIGCMKCGKHLSTDFNYGMRTTREDALKCAKECGFKDVNGVTMCPECISALKSKECADMTETKEKTGIWIAYTNRYTYECSECGCASTEYLEKCPHCNAKMMD